MVGGTDSGINYGGEGKGHGKDRKKRVVTPGSGQGTGQSTVRVTCGSLGRCVAGSRVLSWSPEGRSK